MKSAVPVFRAPKQKYYADTCEPLKRAVARGELRLQAYGRGAYPGLPLPTDMLTEVRALGYWDADRHQDWGLDGHRNEGIELTYVARGKVMFGVDDRNFVLKRGDLTITRPWQRHRVGDPHVSASCLHWLILDVGVRRPNQPWKWPDWFVSSADDIAALTTLLSHNEQPVWQADDEVAHYFEKIGEAVSTNGSQDLRESRIKLYINGLFIALTDMLRRNPLVLDKSLSSTHRTVELFLTSLPHEIEQTWTLDAMAMACGLGRSRFTHYCKQITNMSPTEYLIRCRVTAAGKLLLDRRELSITDVAYTCGFGSSQHFATVFHEYMGCSPREYRRQSIPITFNTRVMDVII